MQLAQLLQVSAGMKQLSLLLLLTLGLLTTGCPIDPPATDDDDSAGTGDDDDSAGDDDDSAGDDDDSTGDDDDSAGDDDDSIGDDDDSASADLAVSGESADCGPDPEPPVPGGLLLNVTGPGAISVLDFDYAVGCCPELDMTADLNQGAATITMGYTLSNDICDCACSLDILFELSGIPAGTWTLVLPGGEAELFTVS